MMVTIKCTNDEWPIYEAYSFRRGLLFRLLRGGWRGTYTGENGEDVQVYRIWAGDKEHLRWLVDEAGLGE